MPLIKKSVKEKVSNHDQSEAIEKGARAFTKGLLEATKKAENIEKHNSSLKWFEKVNNYHLNPKFLIQLKEKRGK